MTIRLLRLAVCGALAVAYGCSTDQALTLPTGNRTIGVPVTVPPPPSVPTATIAVGAVIRAYVGPGDPVCDPQGWDANSPCKRYVVVPPIDGTLKATVSCMVIPDAKGATIDFLIIAPGGGSVFATANEQLKMEVRAGESYEIRINSYPYLLPTPESQEFELRTEL